jgi:hypothetical protein
MGWHFVPAPSNVTPDQIPGLVLWIDANDTATMVLSGSQVTQITSKDPGSKVFTQATGSRQPNYNASILNGKGIMRFVAASGQRLGGPNTQIFSTGSAIQVILVWYCTNDTISPTLFNLQGAAGATSCQFGVYNNGSYNDMYFGASSVGPLRVQSMTRTNTWNATQIKYNGSGATNAANWTGTNNGSSLTTSSSGSQAALAQNVIGDYTFTGAPQSWQGDIAAVLVYDHVLTAGEQTSLNGYISRQWGL